MSWTLTTARHNLKSEICLKSKNEALHTHNWRHIHFNGFWMICILIKYMTWIKLADQIFVFVLPYSFEYVFQRKYDSYQTEHEKQMDCWPFSHIKKRPSFYV